MKKLIALLCIAALLCACTACSTNPNTPDTPSNTTPSESIDIQDPQKDHALAVDTLTRYVTNTGALSNYCITVTYTTDSSSTVTIFLNDGVDKQQENVITNNIVNGSHVLNHYAITKWSAQEKLMYDATDPENIISKEYNEPVNPRDITLSYTLNRIVAPEFYNALLEAVQTAEYDILNNRYIFGTINIPHNDEYIIFENVYCTILNGYIESVTCTNSTQTLSFEVQSIHSTQIS